MLLKRMTIVLLTSGTQRKIRFLEMDDCDGKSDRFVEIGGNELNHRHLTKEWIWQMPNPSWWRSPNWKSRLEASWPNGLVIRNRHLVRVLLNKMNTICVKIDCWHRRVMILKAIRKSKSSPSLSRDCRRHVWDNFVWRLSTLESLW